MPWVAAVILAAVLVSQSAMAGKPRPPPKGSAPSVAQSQNQNQNQQQSQSATQSQTQTTSSTSDSAATATGGSSTSDASSTIGIDDSSTTIALASTAPNPATASGCYIPKRKFGRGWSALWGGISVSAILERDAECVQQIEAEHARYLARLRAEAELERARADRIRREIEFNSVVGKK